MNNKDIIIATSQSITNTLAYIEETPLDLAKINTIAWQLEIQLNQLHEQGIKSPVLTSVLSTLHNLKTSSLSSKQTNYASSGQNILNHMEKRGNFCNHLLRLQQELNNREQ